jgi:hypothetical protein
MSAETTPRDRLVAMVVLMGGLNDGVEASWKRAEAYVAALELFPQNTAKCPCCDKSVQLCTKHYQLHEPGKPCLDCRREA